MALKITRRDEILFLLGEEETIVNVARDEDVEFLRGKGLLGVVTVVPEKNNSLSAESLLLLAKSKKPLTLFALSRLHLPEDVALFVAQHGTRAAKLNLAARTPYPRVLERLANENFFVKCKVAQNPNTPRHVLERFLREGNTTLKELAAGSIDRKESIIENVRCSERGWRCVV